MPLGERLKQLRLEKGLTQSQLASIFNLTKSTISLYESGKRSPDYATLMKFADFFDVTSDYLLNNSASPVLAKDDSSAYQYTENLRQFPVITNIKKNGNKFTYVRSNEWESYLAGSNETNMYWLKVADDALSGDGILPGDLALISEPAPYLQNQIGLVYCPDGKTHLCRVFQQQNHLILQFSNPLYQPLIYTEKDRNKVVILGKLKEIRRKY